MDKAEDLVGFNEPHIRVGLVLSDPVGGDQNFRVGVAATLDAAHEETPLSIFRDRTLRHASLLRSGGGNCRSRCDLVVSAV